MQELEEYRGPRPLNPEDIKARRFGKKNLYSDWKGIFWVETIHQNVKQHTRTINGKKKVIPAYKKKIHVKRHF